MRKAAWLWGALACGALAADFGRTQQTADVLATTPLSRTGVDVRKVPAAVTTVSAGTRVVV